MASSEDFKRILSLRHRKNVGLNVKEYFTYVFSILIEGEKDYEKLLPSAVAR